MAFDGITPAAMAAELRKELLHGKIDKIYQPAPDELMLQIYTRDGMKRLYAATDSASASVRLVDRKTLNPPTPLPFCMLLRKHLSGGRISSIEQKDSERILEISAETLNELGFTVSKKLIFEIMGKHSNIILVDLETGRVIDSIKRVSIDVNRARQILPGKPYTYPPVQDKIPFRTAGPADLEAAGDTWKSILAHIGGIAPAVARELLRQDDRYGFLSRVRGSIEALDYLPRVYCDEDGMPREYSLFPLQEYEGVCRKVSFDTLSDALEYFYENRDNSSRARQRAHDLVRTVSARLDKMYLKKQRLHEDLQEAENAEELRLFGELLTANIHQVPHGASSVTVTNYYDGQEVTIPLDPRWSANRNAQQYFKRYGKSRTALKEKQVQLTENQESIDYLESVLTYLDNTNDVKDIEDLRAELEETGYIRARQAKKAPRKKWRPAPIRRFSSDGFPILIGRNNKENDELTLRIAEKTDVWLHTKDIPGSHVIVQTGGRPISDQALLEAAQAAAWYSKARTSENVPVDYVPVRHVKKPSGAKPGMVIFTNNRTLYVTPADLPEPAARKATADSASAPAR